MHKMLIRSLLLLCVLFWNINVIEIVAASGDADVSAVTFVTTEPMVGEAIQVSVSESTGEERYEWLVGDVVINNEKSVYVPTEDDYGSWITVRVYDSDQVFLGEDTLYFSKVPVMYIDTKDGQPITSKSTYKSADMYIQGNESFSAQYDGEMEIKGRGNTSWAFPQKPYKIKLDKSTDLFGFGKNKHWVLLSNYLDQSMLRNMTASQISEKLGLTTMQMTWVDVCLNGTYVGCYELCEHIRVDDTRINVFDWDDEAEEIAKAVYKANKDHLNKEDRDAIEDLLSEDLNWITSGAFEYHSVTYMISDYYDANEDITGGYIFELSKEYDEVSKFATTNGLPIMVNTPEYLVTNDRMMSYVMEYWQAYEDAIRAEDGYNADGNHYSELADFDSMVKYWLVMEVMGNNDAHYKSRFAYKDCNEKLVFGPVWDFDWGSGGITVASQGATGWKCSSGTLWKDFINDPYFCVKACEEYWKLRDYLQQIVEEDGVLDSELQYIAEAGRATAIQYPQTTYWGCERLGFGGDVEAFRQYLSERMEWLDRTFATAETLISSLRSQSSNSYIKSEDKISISFENASDGVFSMVTEPDLKTNITVADPATSSLKVYVNGIRYCTLPVKNGEVCCYIDATELTEEREAQNVITVIGKDAEGNTTYTSFATIIAEMTVVAGIPYKSVEDSVEYDVAVPHVVINQVYGGKEGGPVSHDFIELYNPTDTDVDLSHWSLQYCFYEEEGQDSGWEMHELSGVIPAHSSYLVRCEGVENPTEGCLNIGQYDEEWERKIAHKGFAVVLVANQRQIHTSGEIFNNILKQPRVNGYVDMYAIAGDRALDGPIPFSCEQGASTVGTVGETLRRKCFADTDNNTLEGDMECIDYQSASQEYLAYIAPRFSASGAWTMEGEWIPTPDVSLNVFQEKKPDLTVESSPEPVNRLSTQSKSTKKKVSLKVKCGKKTLGKKVLTLKRKHKYKLRVITSLKGKTTFKSKNPKILRISKKGKITTRKKGKVKIVISVNGRKKIIKVKVK